MRTLLTLMVALGLGSALLAQDPPIPADKNPQKTASGLVYSVLRPGAEDGDKPGAADTVQVHYTGWLPDGTVFDSSVQRGTPATFGVGQVIAGWTEGLQLMSVGSKYKFTIPSELAYGKRGSPPKIKPDTPLIFEVELLAITAKGPVFVKANKEKQKSDPSGFKYEVLIEGGKQKCTADHHMKLKYEIWTEDGKLLDHSGGARRRPLSGACASMPLDFLKKGPLVMTKGSRYRFEVPAALTWKERSVHPTHKAGSTTIWVLELEDLVEQPKFTPSPKEKLKTTASGLQYEVIKEGSGETMPKMGQNVTVHYTGWLTDGSVFDSSVTRGQPATFRLGNVIAGWNEGLQLMKPGAIYQFTIPAKLGYGERGSPPRIPGGATLVFRVELIKIGA